jgi:uncharacterized protein (TIGR00255 family)
MTGFGKAMVKKGGTAIEAEVKSVNNRFLDVSFRLPKSMSLKELELREKIKSKVKRGKIYLSLNIKKNGIETNGLSVDKDGLKKAVQLLGEIKKSAKIKEKITVEELLNFQNMFITDENNDSEEDYSLVERAVVKAFDELVKMRKKEGEELAKDLKKRVKKIETAAKKIEAQNQKSIKEYFDKLKDRAAQLTKDITDNPERLNTELALLAERYDVTEECVRLKSHIKLFVDAINDSEEAGRKLNFICQEMNREANTINSKTVSTEISHLGIQVKDELEKIREQIQNIE